MENAIIFFAIIAAVSVILIVTVISRFLLISHPNEVIILSGRKRILSSGESVGYRIIRGGRAVRIPLIEKASRMSLETIPIELAVTNAYSKGGIPLAVDAIANIKIDSKEPNFGNAVERFLTMGEQEIQKISKETLEGNLRGVLASLTPEEVNEDRMKFAEVLMEEAEVDLQKLGIQLDTLKITNISDERDYLNSIGRMKTAEVIANARKAEAEKLAESEEAEAMSVERAEKAKARAKQEIETAKIQSEQAIKISNIQADQSIVTENNKLRIKKAELEKEAIIKEKEAEVAGQKAQVKFEQEVEQERIELMKKRLSADIVEPARAKREAKELEAKGDAASIIADGDAKVAVLNQFIQAYNSAKGNGDKVFILNMLPQLTEILADTIKNIEIDKITVVENGSNGSNGKSIQNLVNQMPGSVVSLFEMLENTTGVDILNHFRKNISSDIPQAEFIEPEDVTPAAINPVDDIPEEEA